MYNSNTTREVDDLDVVQIFSNGKMACGWFFFFFPSLQGIKLLEYEPYSLLWNEWKKWMKFANKWISRLAKIQALWKHAYLLRGKIDAFIWSFEPPLVSTAVQIQQAVFKSA